MTKMSPNLLSKLTWATRKFALLCVYLSSVYLYQQVVGGRMGGVGVELVSFGAHKSLSHKLGYIICHRIPLLPSIIMYFLRTSYSVKKGRSFL
jgi:hypothetical protein